MLYRTAFDVRKLFRIILLSVIAGVLASFGMILFVLSIRLFSNLLFYGHLDFGCSCIDRYLSPLGVFVVLVPVVGGIMVVFFARKFLRGSPGYGVPSVIAAVTRKAGIVKPEVAFLKTFLSAFCIGSGGSVGRVGPIVYMGSSLGSLLGRWFKLNAGDRILLLGCGAASSIAVVFNAPVTGVTFAAELILPELSNKIFIPLVASATIADYIGRMFLGNFPMIVVPHYHVYYGWQFLLYGVLGIIAGFVGIAFTHTLVFFDRFFKSLRIGAYYKVISGGLLVGILGYIVFRVAGRYYLFDVGTNVIDDILAGKDFGILILFFLLFGKMVATSVMLGSGGAGGIFAPFLFVGAVFGAIFALILNQFTIFSGVSTGVCALVGMMATLGGATNLILTSLVMGFEITREYSVILPMVIAVVLSRLIVEWLGRGGVYSYKLLLQGIFPPELKEVNIFSLIKASDVMKRNVKTLRSGCRVADARMSFLKEHITKMPVLSEDGKLIGIVKLFDILLVNGDDPIEKHMVEKDISINAEVTLFDAMKTMFKNDLGIVAVVNKNRKVIGIITDRIIRRAYFNKRKRLFMM